MRACEWKASEYNECLYISAGKDVTVKKIECIIDQQFSQEISNKEKEIDVIDIVCTSSANNMFILLSFCVGLFMLANDIIA